MRALALCALAAAGCVEEQLLNIRFLPASAVHGEGASPSDADAVVLYSEDSLLDKSNGEADAHQIMHHERILILTPAGLQHANVRMPLGFAHGRLLQFAARTITADGSEWRVPRDSVHTSDVRDPKHDHRADWLIFHFPHAEVGAILEVAYLTEGDGWLSWAFARISRALPIARYRLELIAPKRFAVDLRVYNGKKGEAFTDYGDEELHHWAYEARDIAAAPDEPFSDAWQQRERWWAFRVREVLVGETRRVAIFDNWGAALHRLGITLYQESARVFRDFDLALDRSRCPTTRCLVEQAIERAREAELAGWAPFGVRPLARVMRSGSANNWEKAVLLWRLLTQAGLKVQYAATVHEAPFSIDQSFPTPEGLDHVVLYLPPQTGLHDELWIEPTCESCAAGQLPAREIDVPVILFRPAQEEDPELLKEQRIVGAPRVMTGQPLAESVSATRANATVDPASGDVTLQLALDWESGAAVRHRLATRGWGPDEWRKSAESLAHARFAAGRVESQAPSSCDRAQARCRRELRFALPSFASSDGNRLQVPLGLLASSFDQLLPARKRLTDVVVKEPFTARDELLLALPPGWSVERLPAPLQADFDGRVAVAVEASVESDVVTVRRTLRFQAGRWTPDEYAGLRGTLARFSQVRDAAILLRAPVK